jgi:hypothetical protein
MPELLRTRDCVILLKGDAYGVTVDDAMAQAGWVGGQGVQWVTPTTDEPTVTLSDGLYSGFMLWGSDESSDQYTAMTRQFPHYRYGVQGAGGWHILTIAYEKYTYASRTGGGPLVPINYTASDRLVFSLRGYFTTEDEWTLSGDPRAPNNYYIAFVTQAPSTASQFYMGIQVSI